MLTINFFCASMPNSMRTCVNYWENDWDTALNVCEVRVEDVSQRMQCFGLEEERE